MANTSKVPESRTTQQGAGGLSPAPAGNVSAEVEEGKAFAILSYALNFVGLPFFIIPLIMRTNAFSLFHAKQCLLIWLAGLAVSIIGTLLTVICIGPVILVTGGIFLLVLNILGLINSCKSEQKPVPLIGKWAEDWFKGIKKI